MEDNQTERTKFKDIVEPMRKYIVSLIIKDALIGSVIIVISLLTKQYALALFAAVGIIAYGLYICLIVIRSIKGKGLKITGKVIDVSGAVPTTQAKRFMATVKRDPINPWILIKTAEGFDVKIKLKQKCDFEVDNLVSVYLPEREVTQKTADRFEINSYYVIEKELSDWRNAFLKENEPLINDASEISETNETKILQFPNIGQ